MMFSQWLRRLIESQNSNITEHEMIGSLRRPQAGLAVRLETLEGRQLFAVITVDSVADGALATLRQNSTTELREAIEDARIANSTSLEPTTIRFSPSIDGQTIKLNTFLNDLTQGSIMPGPSGLYVRSTTLTIDGETGLTKGITIARDDTAAAFRLFFIGSDADVTFKSVTLKNGLAKGGNGGSFFNASGGGAAGLGGAIYNDGRVEIQNSTLANNKAQGGSTTAGQDGGQGSGGGGLGADGGDLSYGLPENGADGGGPNGGAGGSILDDAGAGGFGGGGGGGEAVSNLGITFSAGPGGNGGFGGGGGSGTGRSSAYTGENGGNGGFGGGGGGAGGGRFFGTPGVGGFGGGNASGSTGGGGAGMGGAIFNKAGAVVLVNSTLTGNQAVGGGNGQGLGGAVFNYNGLLQITASTLSSNTAAQGGRGVYNRDDSATLVATARINNTIIGQSDTLVEDFTSTGGGVTSGVGNLIGKTTSFSGTFITGDPKLSALQDNGGLTPTMALAAGSPAVNAANGDLFRIYSDQRGVGRDISAPDIGAFELVQKKSQTITLTGITNRTYGDADFAISATSSSGLPVTLTATGDATVSLVNGVWTVSITGAGTATITASQDGNASFEAAADVEQTFTIAKAATTTSTSATGPYTYSGDAFIGGTGTVTGPKGLNTVAVEYVYSANADGTGTADLVNAGTYYVAAKFRGDANYAASMGAFVPIVINKADANVTVTGYTGTYDGLAHGATGTATGVNGESVGTLNLGATFTNVPGGTANWTFDGGRNYLSESGSVAIQIIAKRITGTFIAADKVYDGSKSATVLSRSLVGLVGNDAVTLTGGRASFSSKDVGVRTVTLVGATLSGAAAGNYVLDSVATTTATISRKVLTKTAATSKLINAASNGPLTFTIGLTKSDLVDGQTASQLFNQNPFVLTVGTQTYSVKARATVTGSTLKVSFDMTRELKAILAANTTATNGGRATPVALKLVTLSKDGNYQLNASVTTKLFNSSK